METHDYKIRPLKLEDAPRMVEMMQDEQTIRYLQIGGPEYTLETAKCFIENTIDETAFLHRAVVDENDVYQGTISLKNIDHKKQDAEYAISMHPDAQGKGAAKAATEQILDIAFQELDLRMVYLNVLEENQRAVRFYEKVGFMYRETTFLDHAGSKRPLKWYTWEKTSELSQKQKKLVFFIEKKQVIGGGLIFFLSLAQRIAELQLRDVYYVNYPNKSLEERFFHENLHFIDVTKCDFSQFQGADFVIPLNYIMFLLERTRNIQTGRILLFDWQPQQICFFRNQFFYKNQKVELFLSMCAEKHSIASMDKNCELTIEDALGYELPSNLVPVFSADNAKPFISRKILRSDRISIGWLGRLEPEKICPLINLLDRLMLADIDLPIDIHIIGDGNARKDIPLQKYSPKIRFIFTSYLMGDVRDAYIANNIDLMVAMGISALDCAKLSVPVVIPICTTKPFKDDKFVFLYDTKEYSLGWEKEELKKLELTTYTIEEVIKMVYEDGGKEVLSQKCYQFEEDNFNRDISVQKILCAIENSQLTNRDCEQNPVIHKQIEGFQKYRALPGKSHYPYETYILFVQKMNKLNGKNMVQQGLYLAKIVINSGRNILKKYTKKVKGKFNHWKEMHDCEKRYHLMQNSFPAKVEAIKELYAQQKKIKVIFFVMFSSVFPCKPVFEKMLHDELFDPYIMVIPDMQRSQRHKSSAYQTTYEELRQEYGERVLSGFDFDTDEYTEVGEEYQIAFFNNPYSRMAHKFHHVTYFENKNTLPIYVNYGFAAVKYGRVIIKTDFYNLLWKVCLDSWINFEDVKKHQRIKGKNALVTGYVKMDRLADAPIHPKTRKIIIICPHHTVLGWKSLDISNFLSYYDFFAQLPRMYPEIDFVFRPHPLLFSNLIDNKIWTEEQIEEYLAHMTAVPNMVYDHSGDYFELFANSDAMIHDCSSFIGEYLFTEKPCCYMLKSMEEINKVMNPMGVNCMKNYYKAFSEQDILKFIDDVVIAGNDPLKNSREKFAREELKFNYPHATDTVLDTIKTTLGIQ